MSDDERANGDAESEIERAIRANHPALITYVTAGDPSLEATKAYVEALDRGGADLIELGLPFSEPIAEGPTIQAAINRALEAGTTPEGFFELVESLDVEAPLLVMTYYNVILQYGSGRPNVEPFVERAAEAGLAGLIIPDLPAEESDPLRAACDEHGLDLVFIVAPTTAGERLETIMSQASGFVYVQARLGTTGARADVSAATHDSLARLEAYDDVPKAVGFGVSEGDHATEIVRAGADGVIVGSALIDIIAEHTATGASAGSQNVAESETPMADLEAKARELKRGAERGKTLPEPEGP